MLHKEDIILLLIIGLLTSAGCYRKVTCPAYQSQYLLDETAFHNKFTLFNPDSTPKYRGYVKKNRNGIMVQKSYVRKTNQMKTIPMVKIYPVINDSILMVRSTDTLRRDSTQQHYGALYLTVVNNDQLIYNALYGSLLIKKQKKPENISEELKVKKDSVQSIQGDTISRKSKFRLFKKKQDSGETNRQEKQLGVPSNTNPADTVRKDDGF
jgi:hypothetical protein